MAAGGGDSATHFDETIAVEYYHKGERKTKKKRRKLNQGMSGAPIGWKIYRFFPQVPLIVLKQSSIPLLLPPSQKALELVAKVGRSPISCFFYLTFGSFWLRKQRNTEKIHISEQEKKIWKARDGGIDLSQVKVGKKRKRSGIPNPKSCLKKKKRLSPAPPAVEREEGQEKKKRKRKRKRAKVTDQNITTAQRGDNDQPSETG